MGMISDMLGAPKKESGLIAKIADVPELQNSHGGSFMTGLINALASGLTLPRDVYEGKVDPTSEEGIRRANDMAGVVTLGAGAVPAEANSLRMGLSAKKVRDAYENKVWHHGTGPDEFEHFDPGMLGTNTDAHDATIGFHFAGSPGDANLYAEMAARRADPWGDSTGRVLQAQLDMKKPLVISPYPEDGNVPKRLVEKLLEDKFAAADYARAHGYDGIIYPHGTAVDSGETAVVFHPNQIRRLPK